VAEVLRAAQAQVQDAAHTLHAYLGRASPTPSAWPNSTPGSRPGCRWRAATGAAPAELPALLAGWKARAAALDAAADLEALEARAAAQRKPPGGAEARRVSAARAKAAPRLRRAVTQAMQQLGMAGGRFEVALLPQDEPQSFGLEAVELRVAGHAGSTPRALAKVASGGELSRLALAIAVTTSAPGRGEAGGRADADLRRDRRRRRRRGGRQRGALMKPWAGRRQVLAVTHLAQVAACADHHSWCPRPCRARPRSAPCSRWPAKRAWPRSRACWAATASRAPPRTRRPCCRSRHADQRASAPAAPNGRHATDRRAGEGRSMSEWAPAGLARRRDEVVLVTGISGSGKSVALHALEDAGYFCVDNLPPELLRDFIRLEHERFTHRVAVAVDVRTAGRCRLLPLIEQLRSEGAARAPAVPGRQHRRAGAPLLRDAPPAPAVGRPAGERRAR
jgi:hypothetical protein